MNKIQNSLPKVPAPHNKTSKWLFSACALTVTLQCLADGAVVDKVYHPYVDALEQEIELRAIHQDEQPGVDDHLQLYRFSYGRAFGDRWFGEVYLVGEKSEGMGFELEAYELEAKWQLTEQGEYWADWGLLFELEKEAHESIWEYSTGILVEKEWGQWSSTANFIASYEWGSDIDNEIETTAALQLRYRLSPWLEPAVEFYAGQDTNALGPVLMGNIKTGIRRSLHWETGLLFGTDNSSPNTTLRALVEYEF